MNTYERQCPVCGDVFVTKHYSKRFCCAECVQEYEDIKKYLSKRMNTILLNVIEEARKTTKEPQQLAKEYYKKW